MEELVSLGKILSDINRVKIIALLKRENELCVCEICDTLELSQPLVSRHLKQMRELAVVKTQQSGKWIIYSLESNEILSYLFEPIELTVLPKLIACSTKKSS